MQGLQSKWFAVYSKPRMDSLALENLESQGFHCFRPLANNPYQRLSNNNNPLNGNTRQTHRCRGGQPAAKTRRLKTKSLSELEPRIIRHGTI